MSDNSERIDMNRMALALFDDSETDGTGSQVVSFIATIDTPMFQHHLSYFI